MCVYVYTCMYSLKQNYYVVNYIPVTGIASMCGSGKVTKGNAPGCEVTVLSKRMRFMVRVNSSWISLERALEQPSSLGEYTVYSYENTRYPPPFYHNIQFHFQTPPH